MIQLNDLGFQYSSKSNVFNGLTLNVPAGRSVGILGANGAGKTTLIKLISGLITPTSGSVAVLDQNPRLRNPDMYKDLYIVPEESDLPATAATVFIEQFGRFYPNFDNARCQALLADFEVDSSKKLTQMSLGQKKKFIVSFALATNCKIILMDEPTNGLDIPSKAKFRDAIIKHQSDDQTILVCTHQVRDLESIIDSVVLMNEQHAHWFDLAEIPNQISQVVGPTDPSVTLHSELRMGNQLSLITASTNAPTDIDLELLFNTFHNNYSGLITAIEKGAQQ